MKPKDLKVPGLNFQNKILYLACKMVTSETKYQTLFNQSNHLEVIYTLSFDTKISETL